MRRSGKYLVRGGAAETLEAGRTARMVLLEFPTRNERWSGTSRAIPGALAIRLKAATTDVLLLTGMMGDLIGFTIIRQEQPPITIVNPPCCKTFQMSRHARSKLWSYDLDRPDLVPLVAGWLWDGFWRAAGHSLADTLGAVQGVGHGPADPRTFILLVGGRPVGTASVGMIWMTPI